MRAKVLWDYINSQLALTFTSAYVEGKINSSKLMQNIFL